MKIKIWGSRGSIPSPGKHTLKYGGNTTCLEVTLKDNTTFIFDAGTGIRNLGNRIAQESNPLEICIVFTHTHWDHMIGFPFFKPAYSKRFKINLRGGHAAKFTMRKILEHQMEAPFFPVPFSAMQAEFFYSKGEPIEKDIGLGRVMPIPLSHPNGGFGYKLIEDDKSFIFLTDNELDLRHEDGKSTQEYIEFCKGATLLIHDAQYTEEEYKLTKGWGHSTYTAATNLAIEAGVTHFGLFHHDPEHSDDDIDAIVEKSRQMASNKKSKTDCFGVYEGQEIIV